MSDGPLSTSLEGRSAIVTGAGGGIGRAIATELVAAGADVLITYRSSRQAAEAAVEELNALGPGTCRATSVDVRQSEDLTRLIADATAAFDRLDILVNNAGVTDDALVMRMSEEAWDTVVETNLRGTFLASKAALRGMIRARWGRIINITSVVGRLGNPGQANYAAAKAGMIGMTKALAQEVASRAITVNCVAPGFIASAMTAALSTERQASLLAGIPAGRLGAGADVAAGVVYLASEEAAYVTGQTLHVNGGMAMI
jgi:3-oxoacyl-[acyl-carrier protein] reductase